MGAFVVPAIMGALGLADSIFSKRSKQKNANIAAGNANAAGRNNYNQRVSDFSVTNSGVERQRALDPVRNTIVSSILGTHFGGGGGGVGGPGVSFSPEAQAAGRSLVAGGARPGLTPLAPYEEQKPGSVSFWDQEGLGQGVAAGLDYYQNGQASKRAESSKNSILDMIMKALQQPGGDLFKSQVPLDLGGAEAGGLT